MIINHWVQWGTLFSDTPISIRLLLGTMFLEQVVVVARQLLNMFLGGAVESRTMVIKDNSPVLAGIYCIHTYIYILYK